MFRVTLNTQAVRCSLDCIRTTLRKYENTLNQYYFSLKANICFCLLCRKKSDEDEKTESKGGKKVFSWTKSFSMKFMASSINIWIGN